MSFDDKNRYSRAGNSHFPSTTINDDDESNNGNNNSNNGIIIHHGNFIGGDEDTIRKIFRTSKVLRNDRYRSMFLDNISEGKYMMITDANTDTDTKTDADADAI
jgi:hypothetical protein